jgi:transposase
MVQRGKKALTPELPWHSTLSRTRQLYEEDVFNQLFKQVLKQCIDKGMLTGKRQAVDSVEDNFLKNIIC